MHPVIDFHAHVIPDPLQKLLPLLSNISLSQLVSDKRVEQLRQVRRYARSWLRPYSISLHHAQTVIRHMPASTRRGLDEIGALLPLPTLLLESTVTDLKEAMDEACIHFAAVIAHPPLIPNDFILETCAENPSLIPVVLVPTQTEDPATALEDFVKRGAKMLKLHPAAEGEAPDSAHYKTLLAKASDLGIPVIIHTGCFHSSLYYKNPTLGKAERFCEWFKTYSGIKFILAHMNFHEPQMAMDLAEEHPNIFLDTSWQPAEVIGEAVRRVGSEKILFGTDWPFVGHNHSIGVNRIRDCVTAGTLKAEESDLILGGNAVKLLNLSWP
jgi:predicted TIM-barrel fold metal-dependent hydrolase